MRLTPGGGADMQVEAETEKLEREINKRLSIGQLDLKREASHKQEELKDKLFVELRDKLPTLWRRRITSGFWTAR